MPEREAQSDGKLKPSKLSHIDQSIPCAQVPKQEIVVELVWEVKFKHITHNLDKSGCELTLSLHKCAGSPIMYTRFLWMTLTLARCFLDSTVDIAVVGGAAFGLTFWVLCFFSAFFSATVLLPSSM